MFLVVLVLCVVAVIAAAASAALMPRKTYGYDDAGKTVVVKRGEALRVSLPENPSTGYSWNLTVSGGLYVAGDQYVPDDTSGLRVGSGGIHTWDIKANGIGLQQITGVYRRPWEKSTAPEKTFALNVQVRDTGLASSDNGSWNLPKMFKIPASKLPPTLRTVS